MRISFFYCEVFFVKNYVLAQSFNRANVQDRIWYAMTSSDINDILANEKVEFGDKVYIIEDKAFKICGNDNQWYDM